jgi:DNA-binding NtrC family response regulator
MKPEIFETAFFVGQPLRVLVIEHSPADAKRSLEALKHHGYKVSADVVTTPEAFTQAVGRTAFDVVLSNFALPGWTAVEALDLLGNLEQRIPFILVTDALDDDTAAAIIDKGADDYILKDRLGRLPLAVRRVMRERRLMHEIKRAGEERERLILKLQETLAEVKRLNGLVPICVTCKRVLSAEGIWSRIEFYIERYSDARVSPSLCPECDAKLEPGHFN